MVQRNLRPAVLLQRPGQQPGLGEHLEAVADPTTGPPSAACVAHRVHDRREAGDGARAGGSRRGRSRRGRRPRRRRPTMRSPCHRSSASPPSASIASTASSSQFEPGKMTTPTRAAIRRARRPWIVMSASSITGLMRNRWHTSSACARALASSGASSSKRIALPTRTPRMPSKPRAGSDRSIVAPCGSAMPGRRRVSTSTEKSMRRAYWRVGLGPLRPRRASRANARPGDALVGLDVALARRRDDLGGQRRRRRGLVPVEAVEVVAHRLLVEARRRDARLPLVGRPEAAGVGRQHLVAQHELAVDEPELELRVGDDDPALARHRGARR